MNRVSIDRIAPMCVLLGQPQATSMVRDDDQSCDGERREKSPGQDPGQVSVGKTSVSKPFDDASLTYQVLPNQR
jgi:hypothetical protein